MSLLFTMVTPICSGRSHFTVRIHEALGSARQAWRNKRNPADERFQCFESHAGHAGANQQSHAAAGANRQQ
jgi:hypothetical protein